MARLNPPANAEMFDAAGNLSVAWGRFHQDASGKVNDLTEAVSTLPALIDALTVRVDALTASVATLTTRVDALAGADVALAASTSFLDDTAAAVGGVGIGSRYRNGSVVMVRVA